MTRLLKFRAWDKVKKQFVATFNLTRNGSKFQLGIKEGGDAYHDYCLRFEPWDELEVTQFTGVLDKNGKEIFEGDIVRHDYAVAPKEFPSGGIMVVGNETPDGMKIVGLEMFDPVSSTTYTFDANTETQEDVEVLGNIYENPELLK
jgi:uncharacterized phage protein (TIGR01671 family)